MGRKDDPHGLRSQDMVLIAEDPTELGKKPFIFFAPSTRTNLQKKLKLQDLVTLNGLKAVKNRF